MAAGSEAVSDDGVVVVLYNVARTVLDSYVTKSPAELLCNILLLFISASLVHITRISFAEPQVKKAVTSPQCNPQRKTGV